MNFPCLTTSWDDGHPLDLRVAEMLERHGLTGTFYIPRSIETGTMTESQMRELAGRFEIGAHTLNHVFLADAPDAAAKEEIEGSKRWIEDVTGKGHLSKSVGTQPRLCIFVPVE